MSLLYFFLAALATLAGAVLAFFVLLITIVAAALGELEWHL